MEYTKDTQMTLDMDAIETTSSEDNRRDIPAKARKKMKIKSNVKAGPHYRSFSGARYDYYAAGEF